MTHYYTIEKPSQAQFTDRNSRFVASAFPLSSVDEFKKRKKEIKDEHPKAAHYCYAYHLGTTGDVSRSGDDGEPAGTAGKSILGQMNSKNITNAGVIVVRYFGGQLLGKPGLMHAYKTVTAMALQLTPIVQKPILEQYELLFDYTISNEVMMFVKRYSAIILKNELQLFCRLVVAIPKAEEAVFLDRAGDLQGLRLEKI